MAYIPITKAGRRDCVNLALRDGWVHHGDLGDLDVIAEIRTLGRSHSILSNGRIWE